MLCPESSWLLSRYLYSRFRQRVVRLYASSDVVAISKWCEGKRKVLYIDLAKCKRHRTSFSLVAGQRHDPVALPPYRHFCLIVYPTVRSIGLYNIGARKRIRWAVDDDDSIEQKTKSLFECHDPLFLEALLGKGEREKNWCELHYIRIYTVYNERGATPLESSGCCVEKKNSMTTAVDKKVGQEQLGSEKKARKNQRRFWWLADFYNNTHNYHRLG